MTDILITGGRGFIGKNLTKKLDHLGLSYISIDSKNGDINNQKTFSSLPKVKTVIHLAGKVLFQVVGKTIIISFLQILLGLKMS